MVVVSVIGVEVSKSDLELRLEWGRREKESREVRDV